MKKSQQVYCRTRQAVSMLTRRKSRSAAEIVQDAQALAALLQSRHIGCVVLAADTQVQSFGIDAQIADVLTVQGIACVPADEESLSDAAAIVSMNAENRFPEELLPVEKEGHCCILLPVLLPDAAESSVPWNIALLIETFAASGVPKTVRELAAEAAGLLIRWESIDQTARQRAAYCIAMAAQQGPAGYVPGVVAALKTCCSACSDGALALTALPAVLAAYGPSVRRPLAQVAQTAGLASAGAGDEVAAAALMTWLRTAAEARGLPETLADIRRRDIPLLAAIADRQCNPGSAVHTELDRFELEDVFQRLMQPTEHERDVVRIVDGQRAYFRTGATLPLDARADALTRLRKAIADSEQEIHAALHADLGKCPDEAYLCETGMVLAELTHMQRHFRRYAGRRHVLTPLHQFAADSYTLRRPYGVTLIMSPWNYPFLLTMSPLIGAIAAGNCCVVKPSAYAPATSAVIRQILQRCFPQEHVAVVEGGREENQALLDQRFDKIFFTGGENVGREVLRKAADHLTPVTLELGGKSPVVITESAKIDLAAKRVAFGKLLNAGQTCVAPDYVLVHRSVKNEFVDRLKHHLARMAWENPLASDTWVHMINRRHFDRVMGLIDPARVVYGGEGDAETLRIQPTILDNVTPADAVMQEEIFGPVLPIIEYEELEEAIRFIADRPAPLACYLFTEDRAVKRHFLTVTPFGGGCVNDTIIHLASTRLPFGGVGRSGMGSYHGRYSFMCFSHEAGVVDKATWFDLPMRYAPYDKRMMKLVRFFLK
ncbi:MAG: aldehyde dehydrogenase family protein [Clostridia bacterium]|nr:aldehyde dehydrogenase family protein [Clostridia bacterium]